MPTAQPAAPDPVLASLEGSAGVLTLDRPAALNALTTPMIESIGRALDGFGRDPGVRTVLLRGSTPRAFCAGGDMRRIRELCLAGEHAEAERFFATEYALNRRLAGLDLPLVSLVDGVCMGGGLGLSVHGRFRVATELAVFAMPETALGYFPDVGGSHFLPRLPSALGRWLGQLQPLREAGSQPLSNVCSGVDNLGASMGARCNGFALGRVITAPLQLAR